MADTTFAKISPPLKAIDNGDGTYSVAVIIMPTIVGGTDRAFTNILPPLKAVDNGDGTHSMRVQEDY